MNKKTSQNKFKVIIYLIFAVGLIFSCSIPGLPITKPKPTPTAYQDPLPPVLSEVSPLDGSQLDANETITFFFSQLMDRDSVEAALFGLPPGYLRWSDDSTLSFSPNQSYEPGTEITVAILSSAQAENGLTFVEPVTLTFHTPPLLQAINFLPESTSQDIDPKATVAVTFNQPVVPMGTDSELPAAFSLDPPTVGRGEWLSTSTYVFTPDPALSGGVTYTALLNTDLISTSGMPMDTARSSIAWSFETAFPRIVSIEPTNEQTLSLEPTIKLVFNQAMNPNSVESNFSFLDKNRQINGEISWNDDHTQMTFKPTDILERNKQYSLAITSQAAAVNGTPLLNEQLLEYFTYGRFGVNDSDPAQGQTKSATGNVRIFFSAPPKNVDNLKDYISLSPELSNMGVYISGTNLNISGFYVPESAYTLNISSELEDQWGQQLGQDIEIDFRTPPAKPSLTIPNWGNIFFVRPDEPVLRANATNIQRVDVSVTPISLSDFQLLTGVGGYDAIQSFIPENLVTYTQSYRLSPSRNEQITLPLAGTNKVLETGYYYAQAFSPQLGQAAGIQDVTISYGGPASRPYLVVASHINLLFKMGATDALIWATDLRTNESISAPFVIYDSEGTTVISAQTDEQGLWRGEFSPQENPGQTFTVIMSEPGQDFFGVAQSSWDAGVSPWEFGIPLRPSAPKPKAYLYTDRPIYRPGQTVYFRGVVRQAFNGRYELSGLETVPLEVHDNNGRVIQTLDLSVSPYGTINGEFNLSTNATPGHYSLQNNDMDSYLQFNVAEYRKPEIELSVNFEEEQIGTGEQVRTGSKALYYFGSPAGNVDVQWHLYRQSTNFYLSGYQTGIIDDNWIYPSWASEGDYGRTLESGTDQTDLDGSLALDFTDIPKFESPQILTLELTAEDESGFPVSARDELILHPESYYIGLRPDHWIGQSGKEIGFEVFTTDWNTHASPSKTLQAEFNKVHWERKDPPPEDIYSVPGYERISTLVSSSSLSTGHDGKARLAFTPTEPGTYMLDISGGRARTQILIWVLGEGKSAWPSLLNNQIKLTTDQTKYLPNQTANVFIPNPFEKPVQTLITIERGKILHTETLLLDTNGLIYKLDLTDEHAPNVYIAATLLGENNQFRQGYLSLNVEPSAQELQVELSADPEINEPRGEMTLKLQVRDNSGNPIEGEFSFAVVDKAVLALADPNSPDILTAFYSKQALGIKTGSSLAAYSGRYVHQPPGRGGGGGGLMAPIREEFPDTAYWNPTFLTDSNGKGQVTMTLPDNLTTWVIESRGLTADTQVGQAKTEVVTTKPLLIRPITPRFFVRGDHVDLAAIIHNNTKKSLEVTVKLDSTGFLLDDISQASQTVDVPANGRERVTWWGTVEAKGETNLVFAVNSKDGRKTLSDAATPLLGAIPIIQYTVPQAFVTSGMLLDGGTRQEVVSLPRSFTPIDGKLDVEMSPSLAASILTSLDALPKPSCMCNNEAVLSYFLPNLEIYHALQAAGIDDPVLKERLDEILNESIASLVGNQNFDGSWGWISGSKANPYISTYVLFGLGRARLAGIQIPEDTFEHAHEYLREYALVDPRLGTLQPWELDRLTFTLFALSQTSGLSQDDTPVLNAMFEKRDQLSPWAQALLALSLVPDNSQARDLIANLEATSIRTGSSVNWESDSYSWRNPGTPLYTTAIVVYALAQHDAASPVLIEAVRYLVSNHNKQGLWGSSYENTWVILALTEAMKGFGELQADFSFSASVNGAKLAAGAISGNEIFTPINASVPLENLSKTLPNALIIEREPGLGRLYYRASLLLNQPVEMVQSLNKGMDISRAYFDDRCGDSSPMSEAAKQPKYCKPLSTIDLAADSRVTSRLTLTLPNDSYYVSIEDHIPAGTEILDQTLKTSQLGEEGTDIQINYDVDDPFAHGWGWWYFSDPQIYDDHISWWADYLPAGTYELTYTLIPTHAGEFHILPAHAWQSFFPDVQGTSSGAILEIR